MRLLEVLKPLDNPNRIDLIQEAQPALDAHISVSLTCVFGRPHADQLGPPARVRLGIADDRPDVLDGRLNQHMATPHLRHRSIIVPTQYALPWCDDAHKGIGANPVVPGPGPVSTRARPVR